ncbi:MAG: Rpn family recombination-promoting nuclease/putative transposase [Lachnospiraceae bacterium]|nr:Rpn family recombination-promoting nuclease/putative transposase [Lachnospiraceae bacterium]
MEKFQDLNLSNAFLFAATAQDPEACRAILQIVLEREIPQVNVHAEHTVLFSSDYRMIRLDVYGEDEMDVQYNIEMQNQNEGNLPHRARYHHAEMDVSSLKPGMNFRDLRPSYVIFICTFDPFGEGLYRYTFTRQCKEADISLEDDTCTIYFNTKGKNPEDVSEELIEFMAYLEESTDESVRDGATDNIKLLHKKVKQVKQNADLEAKYMTGEDLLRWSKAEGKAEGKAESILVVLASKYEVSDELREKILCQTDISVLDEWIVLAANATSIEDFISKSSI